MLMELRIRNFGLIDNVNIEYYKGLNILTGETGAGKSILIDSVNFILGEKQTRDIIRTGQSSAYAEAVFQLQDNPTVTSLLSQNGIETDDLLIISREININGRSVSRINGRTVTIGTLKQFSRLLIDIHGQHEHQSLLDEETHIDILDSFCRGDFGTVKMNYKNIYLRIKEIDNQLEKLKADDQIKLRQIDLLKFQISEITEAKLHAGEEEELKRRREILVNSEKIYNSLTGCYQNLYENEETGSAYDEIGISISGLDSIQKYDDNLKDIKISLDEIYYKLEDIINNIRNYRNSIEFDENELSEIEFRLDLINRLKRKYGNSIESIISYHEKIKLELDQIEKSDEIIEELSKERKKCYDEIITLANEITVAREETAKELKILIENELKYLGMEKSIFEINVKTLDSIKENGMNVVRFNISTNPGEPPKPLSKVVSGGEMSRIMLAIKSVIANVDKMPTLIFDEIDTGISGRTAQAVAEKMTSISGEHQLLCVTHLPQIAAMADVHFKIEKIVNKGKTSTFVQKLDEMGQIEELARMLGGALVTDITREHSKEMIKLAKIIKSKI